MIRFFSPVGEDRLLVMNFASVTVLEIVPEPLLAPPVRGAWETIWSSEDPRYGGNGTPPVVTSERWRLPAEAAVLLGPSRAEAQVDAGEAAESTPREEVEARAG